ncbi:hypothetical protein DFH11DRAFT_1618960 [Phellopilus nigrolimitatus]|nr:hypothetical protein DFH11DRAFT_1618960 [Phellopilus nigrolimitatus]
MSVNQPKPRGEAVGLSSQERIRRSFEKNMTDVQAYSDRIYHDYVDPALEQAKAFSRVYPVLFVFITIFSFFSFLPVACFVATSLLILSTFVFASLTFAILASAAIITVLGTALLGTLLLICLLSMFLTSLAIGAYLVVRLFSLLRSQGSIRDGVAQWGYETKEHVYTRLPRKSYSNSNATPEESEDAGNSVLRDGRVGEEAVGNGESLVMKTEG